ncbi:TIGR03086 family protein [Spongiactinospora gelatinilytica]|uniref:TIGR03086 family protein n=1 Tax=Spongiactinospora gelatinilytica TaxID=2666298 RepID=A0A2W2FJN8_9ACTN|nr:TIGR03086 family metal-binding protein [Spongiactinospora gelatinilytica]PZG25550.1 TIGR03086 family protein [Spongiactinospora gelatinilytica]
MSDARPVTAAGRTLIDIIRDLKPDHLTAPTPCADFDVRALVHHLLFWGPSLEGAARKKAAPPPAATEGELDLTGGDWAADLVAQVGRTATAWDDPAAWTGTTHMGGPTELPAALVGGMVVVEFLVHGWDLARAAGRPVTLDAALLAYAHEEVAKTAAMGREMGVYGPEVPVPDGSPPLDRVLGLTGRDPSWTP